MSDKYPGGFVTTGAPEGFSVAFDGSGDYLSVPSSANLAFSTSDFQIEVWLYPSVYVAGNNMVYDGRSANGAYPMFNVVGSTKKVEYYVNSGVQITSTNTVELNTWTHIMVSRVSGTTRMFINGVVQSGTWADSTTYLQAAVRIGLDFAAALGNWNGYMSNVRVLKGSGTSSSFTPPTQLFPVTNTQLLTCQSPTIIDNSTNNFTITANGDSKVSNFTPFAGYKGFNPALGAAAGGVWTLDEAAYYQQNRIWPIYDPYFNQTTLMLHGNGTNAAQNNTFLDSSTNNFTITRNGNTTQGTFTPFSQTGWSNYFGSSTSDGITFASNAAFSSANTFSAVAISASYAATFAFPFSKSF
jgi:hypothetical protein